MKIISCNEKNRAKAAQLRKALKDPVQLEMLQQIPDYKEIQIRQKQHLGGLVTNTIVETFRRRGLSGRVFGDVHSIQCDLTLTQFSDRYEAVKATLAPHEYGLGYNLLMLGRHSQLSADANWGARTEILPDTERTRLQGQAECMRYCKGETTYTIGLGGRYDTYAKRVEEGLTATENAKRITLSRLPSAFLGLGANKQCSRGGLDLQAEFSFGVPPIVEVNAKQAQLEQKKIEEEENQTPTQSFNQTKFGLDKFIFGLRLAADLSYRDQFVNGVFWTQLRSKIAVHLQNQKQIVVEPPLAVKGLFDELESSGKLLVRSWAVLGVNLAKLFTTKQPVLKWLDFALNYANLLLVDDKVGVGKDGNTVYIGVGNGTVACLWDGKQVGLAFGLLE